MAWIDAYDSGTELELVEALHDLKLIKRREYEDKREFLVWLEKFINRKNCICYQSLCECKTKEISQ